MVRASGLTNGFVPSDHHVLAWVWAIGGRPHRHKQTWHCNHCDLTESFEFMSTAPPGAPAILENAKRAAIEAAMRHAKRMPACEEITRSQDVVPMIPACLPIDEEGRERQLIWLTSYLDTIISTLMGPDEGSDHANSEEPPESTQTTSGDS